MILQIGFRVVPPYESSEVDTSLLAITFGRIKGSAIGDRNVYRHCWHEEDYVFEIYGMNKTYIDLLLRHIRKTRFLDLGLPVFLNTIRTLKE
jgi:hypothetical protein